MPLNDYDDYMSKHWGLYPVGVDEEGKTIYDDGAINWGTLRSVKTIDEIMDVVKKELDSGKPVIISGSSSSGDYIGPHYVLAVGYYNDGNNQSDYIVIDTEGIYIDGVYNKGSGTERMDIFYEHFPDETGTEGYKYMLY